MMLQSRSTAARFAVWVVFVAALSACGSSEDRARDHIAKAAEYLAEKRPVEAKLELRSALQFDPTLVDAHNDLARIELAEGNPAAALTHTSEAHRLDPSNSEAALRLADLMLAVDPEKANSIIEATIAREPENPAGYLGRSRLALSQGRMHAAATATQQAMKLDPDDPGIDWHYGTIMQGMIQQARLGGVEVDDSVHMGAVAGFQRYVEKDGPAPWAALIEQARSLSTWPKVANKAPELFRSGVERAREEGSIEDQLAALTKTISYARSFGNKELLDWSLELLLGLRPENARTWRQLAELRGVTRKDPQAVWDRALAEQGENPQIHLEYARFLVFRWQLDDALAHLQAKADEGIDPPVLMGAVASTQLAAGRRKEAERTVRLLEQQHPGHPRTILERAQFDLRNGEIRKAIGTLNRLVEQHPDPDAYRLLSRAQEVSSDRTAAIEAIEKAIETRGDFHYEDQRTRARLLAAAGRCEDSMHELFAIQDRMSLSDQDMVMLARCQYETDLEQRGRRVLEKLLAKPAPPAEAVLLYAQREGSVPERGALARGKLEKLLQRDPSNWAVITELTRLDLTEKRTAEALARLDAAVEANGDATPARVRLLRARVSAEMGREEGTIADAKIAFESQPRMRGALELLVALYLRKNQIDEAVAATEEARRVGAFDQDRRMLLGRLYRAQGRNADALQIFETALAQDESDPSLYFELGQALQSLERTDEAITAFEKALSIDTNFPEASAARRALEGTRSAGAS
jgi:tetratricopeptide (TPR) repeat protein